MKLIYDIMEWFYFVFLVFVIIFDFVCFLRKNLKVQSVGRGRESRRTCETETI